MQRILFSDQQCNFFLLHEYYFKCRELGPTLLHFGLAHKLLPTGSASYKVSGQISVISFPIQLHAKGLGKATEYSPMFSSRLSMWEIQIKLLAPKWSSLTSCDHQKNKTTSKDASLSATLSLPFCLLCLALFLCNFASK